MNNSKEWFRDWFDDEYLELYAHRDLEESRDFLGYLSEMKYVNPGKRVADLACGAGRYSWVAAREHGCDVVGLDLSRALLNQAVHTNPDTFKEGESDIKTGGKENIPYFIQADIRALPLKSKTFELLLCMFTSFGYFPNDTMNKEVLIEFERILKSGGTLILDLMNEYVVRQGLVPEEDKVVNGKKVYYRRWIDEENRRVEKEIKIIEKDGNMRKVTESVRLFEFDEIEMLLKKAGFSEVGVVGNYGGYRYDETNSPRMILLAEK
ncbi:class I SAM-dependent methyltransferase [bacterium]|nr:class I SAM-dependent methyltransferase [bacterium]